MTTFLSVLIILAAIAALAMLIRGIVIFLQTSRADLNGDGLSVSGIRQNKAMRMRIFFQAIAILLVVMLLLLRPHSG